MINPIKRVATVSVETMKIVDNLPPLREAEQESTRCWVKPQMTAVGVG